MLLCSTCVRAPGTAAAASPAAERSLAATRISPPLCNSLLLEPSHARFRSKHTSFGFTCSMKALLFVPGTSAFCVPLKEEGSHYPGAVSAPEKIHLRAATEMRRGEKVPVCEGPGCTQVIFREYERRSHWVPTLGSCKVSKFQDPFIRNSTLNGSSFSAHTEGQGLYFLLKNLVCPCLC